MPNAEKSISLENATDVGAGLTSKEVSDRIAQGKVNGDFNIPSKSVKQIFKDNCLTFFNLINIILAAFVVAVGSFKNCLFLGVIICNTAIGIFQEIRSKRAIDKLALISAPKADVLRNGEIQTIAVKDIVLDDIMILSAGRQVCSDCIAVEGDCEVNESLVTGESDPIVKHMGDEILSGSFLISGNAKAQVIRIGADNYANKITSGAKYIKKNNSKMLASINYILKMISVCIIPMILLMFGKEMLLAHSTFTDAVVNTVSAIIGMIPEGLVLMASMVLAVSVIRLATNKTLAQDLYCVETLARVDVLCLDKTGTITEGRMEVSDVISLDGNDHEKALCEMIYALGDNNPTALAVMDRYKKDGFLPEREWSAKTAIHFSSAKKWSLAAFEDKGTYILGAAEFILGDAMTDALREQIKTLSEGGYRVVLFAHSDNMPPEVEGGALPENITPVALVRITDCIRKEAPATLKYFAEQDVDIRIISGDSPVTVSGVAQRAGLEHYENYVDASTLTTDEELWEAADKYKIFGRVTPYQKLELVKALKAKGHTVAMTGDGVNDVLALKESDCSIAMQSGSDAARNVSNIVLLDSNFASMPKIVGEGRRSINNIERSSVLFLYKTVYSFLAALMFCFVPMGYPLQAIQLTQINMFTNGIPSFLLAMEPNFKRVKGEFIENVLPRSIMHGLLITFNFVGIVLMRYISGWMDIIPRETFDYSIETMSTICIGFAAFVILFKVCMPFKPWKIGLFIFLIGGFTADIFILRDFLLDLKPMCFEMVVMTGILMGATVLIEALSSFFERHITDNLLAFQRYWKDVFIRMSAKRKAGKENKNA